MSTNAPFSLRIFVVDGDPDGLRLVERTNWVGKAVVFPRSIYTQIRNRPEFQQTSVYLLMGPRTDGEGEMLYVGEGDPVRPRLDDHFAKRDFWTSAVFFVAPGQLNKAHVQFLESQLINRAHLAKRVQLDNGNKPAEPTLSEADRADMNLFLSNILGMLPVLGVHAFEQSPALTSMDLAPGLLCQGNGAKAQGRDTPQGFVIEAGSTAVLNEVPSLKSYFPSVIELRSELLKNGVLVEEAGFLKFTQAYTFSSPSYASSVILGRSSNGRTDWRDAAGKTLKEIQEAQAVSVF